jgi:hypothetical protein
MRSESEIQEAHDLLTGFFLEKYPMPPCQKTILAMHATADVLCWVLEHKHNPAFDENLKQLRAIAEGTNRRN